MKSIRRIPNRKRLAIAFLVIGYGLFVGYTPERPSGAVQTIILDAGHGGSDPGNLGTGRYKTTEKDITLDVTLQVAAYLEDAFPGINIILTRDNDSYPELEERVRIANDNDADLFVSIHCDAFTKESAKGSSTFVMGMHRSEEALRVAMKENASIFNEKDYEKRYNFDPNDPDTYIALTLRQNTYLDQSLLLSSKIQTQFRDRVGRVDRGVRQAGYYVICFTAMPSVLVELGFLTNKQEEDFLNSQKGKDYMSSAIFRAIRDYKEEMDGKELASFEEEEGEEQEQEQEEEEEEKMPWTSDIEYREDVKGIYYQVQIVTSSEQIPMDGSAFNGLEKVDEYFSNGLYKYAAGKTANYDEAKKMQSVLRENGFTGAFVIAFKRGKRISLADAQKELP